MNLEQQQIAIAKAHGRVQRPDGSWFPIGKDYGSAGIPNYPFDLNAMHEAEELFYAKSDTLEGAERMRDYSKWLCLIAKYPLHATATQRAEAFLRTIGKWEEAK
jgi:hypothetical protein